MSGRIAQANLGAFESRQRKGRRSGYGRSQHEGCGEETVRDRGHDDRGAQVDNQREGVERAGTASGTAATEKGLKLHTTVGFGGRQQAPCI